jgi:redox-sensing transcriptional repressor
MQKEPLVSMSVVRRLPRYYRRLTNMHDAGIERISSTKLAESLGLTASQIRQDLSCFGEFGQQGYGYNVDALYEEIGNILGLKQGLKAVLIGAGNLGMALVNYINFQEKGFQLVGIFEASEKLIGQTVHGLTIRSEKEIEDFCGKHKPDVAILCVPMDAAENRGERLIALGIRSFWNFTHYDFTVTHPDVIIENVHMNDSLMTLCYRIHHHNDGK